MLSSIFAANHDLKEFLENHWTVISNEEMQIFFELSFLMGIIAKPSIHHYRSNSPLWVSTPTARRNNFLIQSC